MEITLVLGAAILWAILAVMAIVSSLWAIVSRSQKRTAATFALCFWCVVAGGTLTSALWSWMTSMNVEYQNIQIARLPANQSANQVVLEQMAMLKFFVKLDEFGRRLLYFTVILPLMFSLFYFRRASYLAASTKAPEPAEKDFFSREP